jgi:hypothetical protein
MKIAISIPFLFVLTIWAAACLWYDGPESRLMAGALSTAFVVAVIALLFLARPVWRLWVGFLVLFVVVQAWWLGIEPSNDREWLVDVARPPSATFDGDLVTISNVRNFHYRSETDFDENWETRTYDLSQIRGLDIYLSYWGSPMIAHTIMRQFELYYVAADERDLIGLRTNHRGEDVYLYRMTTPVPRARALLVNYLETMNQLVSKPRWYNALLHNCTTVIRQHAQHVAAQRPFDWRIIVNGYIDELGYERGTIDTSLPFEELRRKSNITEKGKAAGTSPDFSQQIRKGLPTAGREPLTN